MNVVSSPDVTGTAAKEQFSAVSIVHDYVGVRALHGVSFEMDTGVVHGLVGENGSGKSTLIKVLTGVHQPTTGEIILDGEAVSFSSPADAQHHGIGVVHQDYHLFPELSVAANVHGIALSPPRHKFTQAVDKAELNRRVHALLSQLQIDLPAHVPVRDLGPAERKFVEIARAMLLKPRFLILDEPTASLEPQGSRAVLDLLSRLREQGVGLAFVSHRLDEVLHIADRVTVLRDGRLVHAGPCAEMSEHVLAEHIVGREHEQAVRRRVKLDKAPTTLRVSDLRIRPETPPISFEVRKGEILGLTGLLGSGASEIVHMVGGARRLTGAVSMYDVESRIRSPRDARRVGIGFIPEDRKAVGLVPEQSVAINVALPSLASVSKFGWINRERLYDLAESFRKSLDIRTKSVRAPVSSLSGGNQQKVMLAKWLASGVELLVVEEPTHGIDIGGKAQVHDLLRRFADDGGSVLVASTDVHEVLELCDRIGIMRHGALIEMVDAESLTHASLTAAGVRDEAGALESLIETGEVTGEMTTP